MTQRLRTGAVVVLLTTGLMTAVMFARAAKAAALTRAEVLAAAAAYGPGHGYRVGIAVYDTARGQVYGSGADTGTFASESVVKAMIATRLLVQGRMHGTTAQRAYRMITRSDDAIASSFYGSVGGDNLINWVKKRYRVWDLGSPPRRPGWWGNTNITPRGLVKYYARMKHDSLVAPWLLNAMHHAAPYGSDGTYQFFGLPQASSGVGIKQGWGCDYAGGCDSADFNTTGFVNGNRYAVAILARGPLGSYGRPISSMLTRTAKLLLPEGQFPEGTPQVRSVSRTTGRVSGGQRVGVHGVGFTHVRAVLFGGVPGTAVRVLSPSWIRVTTPPHAAGTFGIRVVTTHGTSALGTVRFKYLPPPRVTSISPAAGSAAGGETVTITGTGLSAVTAVLFGGTPAASLTVNSSTSLTVVAPAHAAAQVDVTVRGPYGPSASAPGDIYTYTG
jgi:hypothetical protein